MAKKKAIKKASKKKAGTHSTSTRCEQGGQEFTPPFIAAQPDQRVELVLTLCKSAFLVHAFYAGEKILEATSSDLPNDEAPVVLPRKPPGVYALNWGYLAATDKWQVKSEVSVAGAVRLRQRKSNESAHATNQSFVYIDVQA